MPLLSILDFEHGLVDKETMAGTLYEELEGVGKLVPERLALLYEEHRISYYQLLCGARRFAYILRHHQKVDCGERIALLLPNCPEYVMALFGIWGSGCIGVPINTYLKAPELAYIIRDADVRCVVTHSSFAATAEEAVRLSGTQRCRIINVDGAWVDVPAPDLLDLPVINPSQPALLIYTSGTTGRPKGAVLSHKNLLANVESCKMALDLSANDRLGLLLPMFHSFMITVCVLLPLLIGGSTMIVRSIHPIRSAVDRLAKSKVTILPAMPQLFAAMAQVPVPVDHRLRLCISGSAPLPIKVLEEFEAHYKVPLLEGYGLSEASPVVSVNPIRGKRKIGSVGLPIPGVQVTIRDDDGNILPAGAIGELWIRGENVMLGYWNDANATREVLRDGWLLTGDLGFMDDEGYLYITDRKKDMILVRGNNVYPREIEEWLYRFPGIREVAVVGEPDEGRGERPVAFIVAEDRSQQPSPDFIIAFLRERLADYKVPRRIEFVDELPRNATGKILKRVLRDWVRKKGSS